MSEGSFGRGCESESEKIGDVVCCTHGSLTRY